MARSFSHDWHLLVLLGLVLLVSVVGFLTIETPSDAPTGQVVLGTCDRCPAGGDPVCAVRGTTALDYENGCRAACDGARIIAAGVCADIPTAGE